MIPANTSAQNRNRTLYAGCQLGLKLSCDNVISLEKKNLKAKVIYEGIKELGAHSGLGETH